MLPLLTVALAAAAPVTGGPGIGLLVTGEAMRDDDITYVYGDTSLGGEAVANVPLPWRLELGARVGYRRLGGTTYGAEEGDATWLWYAPVTLLVSVRHDVGRATLLGGLGPSYLLWAEQPGGEAGVGYLGGKFGVLFEGGVRVRTDWIRPSLHDPDQGVQALDLYAGLGYRWSFRGSAARRDCGGEPCGLDFSALRASAGLVVGF